MFANFLAAAVLATGAAAPAAAPATIDAMLKRAQYEQVQISPDGQLLAIAHRVDDGTEVTILRRTDKQTVAQVDPGSGAKSRRCNGWDRSNC